MAMPSPRTLALVAALAALAAAVAYAGVTARLAPPAVLAGGAPAQPGTGVPAGVIGFLPGTPGHRLEEYVAADFAGERLERAAWAKFKQMVVWPSEPSWDEAYVVRGFRVAMGPSTATSAKAEVTYETLGALSLETYVYTDSPSRQAVPYDLLVTGGEWKLGVPILKPHVGPEGAHAFLARMREHHASKRAAIDASMAAIREAATRTPLP